MPANLRQGGHRLYSKKLSSRRRPLNCSRTKLISSSTRSINERTLNQLDYNVARLTRSINRRGVLFAKGAESEEPRDIVQKELSYDLKLQPLQAASNERQETIRQRQVALIEEQLKQLQENLRIVHAKLDNLRVRAPIPGRLTDMDIKVGETRNPGQRLAEITPDAGIKVSADVDEYYLSRVRNGEASDVTIADATWHLHVIRVYPQVKDGQFVMILLLMHQIRKVSFLARRCREGFPLGGDDRALLLPAGPFLQQTGGDWIFALTLVISRRSGGASNSSVATWSSLRFCAD